VDKLLACLVVGEECSGERRGGGYRVLLLNTAHLHAHVRRLDDNRHAQRLKRFLNTIADLNRKALLHLKAAGVGLNYSGDLA